MRNRMTHIQYVILLISTNRRQVTLFKFRLEQELCYVLDLRIY